MSGIEGIDARIDAMVCASALPGEEGRTPGNIPLNLLLLGTVNPLGRLPFRIESRIFASCSCALVVIIFFATVRCFPSGLQQREPRGGEALVIAEVGTVKLPGAILPTSCPV